MKQLSLLSFVSGTLIVLAPIIQNVILLAMVAHLLAVNPKGEVNLNGTLGSSYQGWCMFIGICLLSVGVVSGFRVGTLRAVRTDARDSSVAGVGSPVAENA